MGNLTELSKSPQVLVRVMQGWTKHELRTVHPTVSEEMVEAFGCVPRWCMYSSVDDTDLQKKLFDNFGDNKLQALYEFMKMKVAGTRPVQHKDLPYRVVCIEDSPKGWGATKFISTHVAGLFAKEAWRIANGKTTDFVHMMQNPFGKQAIGPLFEEWAFVRLSDGVRLNLHGEAAGVDGVFDKAGAFERHDMMSISNAKCKIDPDTLYRAPVGYPTIDMYGIVKSADGAQKHLILLQSTVGHQHRAGVWSHVANVVKAARAEGVDRVTLVYLVPKDELFVVPACPTFIDPDVAIVSGSLDEDMGVPLKVWNVAGV